MNPEELINHLPKIPKHIATESEFIIDPVNEVIKEPSARDIARKDYVVISFNFI